MREEEICWYMWDICKFRIRSTHAHVFCSTLRLLSSVRKLGSSKLLPPAPTGASTNRCQPGALYRLKLPVILPVVYPWPTSEPTWLARKSTNLNLKIGNTSSKFFHAPCMYVGSVCFDVVSILFGGKVSFNPKIGEEGWSHHFGPKKSRRSKEVVPAYLLFARNPEIPLAINMKNPLSFCCIYLNRCNCHTNFNNRIGDWLILGKFQRDSNQLLAETKSIISISPRCCPLSMAWRGHWNITWPLNTKIMEFLPERLVFQFIISKCVSK